MWKEDAYEYSNYTNLEEAKKELDSMEYANY